MKLKMKRGVPHIAVSHWVYSTTPYLQGEKTSESELTSLGYILFKDEDKEELFLQLRHLSFFVT